jgi:hypothetical protein
MGKKSNRELIRVDAKRRTLSILFAFLFVMTSLGHASPSMEVIPKLIR